MPPRFTPKPLPVATPHSQVLSGADLGMDVTVLHPPGYDLDPDVIQAARSRAEALGGSLSVTHDIHAAARASRTLYLNKGKLGTELEE